MRPCLATRRINADTREGWLASFDSILSALEKHFGRHDYVLGGRPSLADFALMGPLYGHVFHDAVSGFRLKANYPLVAEWVTRTMAQNALNARPFGAVIYQHVDGSLVGAPAASDGAEFLAGDEVPETLLPVLRLWFGEFWPVLESTMERFTNYLTSQEWEAKAATNGGLLPGKTFAPSPGFEAEQSGDGPLMHDFQVGGVAGRRMCSGYHLWMLGRLETVLEGCVEQGESAVRELLGAVGGSGLLGLGGSLAGCRARKQDGNIYAAQ